MQVLRSCVHCVIQNAHFELKFKIRTLPSCENSLRPLPLKSFKKYSRLIFFFPFCFHFIVYTGVLFLEMRKYYTLGLPCNTELIIYNDYKVMTFSVSSYNLCIICGSTEYDVIPVVELEFWVNLILGWKWRSTVASTRQHEALLFGAKFNTGVYEATPDFRKHFIQAT